MGIKTRTNMAIKNAMWGMITQVLNIVLGFISRTIFIRLLNTDYLGINGLFTNILMVLSFAELGIGNAIVFSLYKPIEEKNTDKIKALMNFYKVAYRIIGLIILSGGILCIPFLHYIISEPPNISENLIVIFLLFLVNTVVSYLFGYKKTLITASQNDYIVQIYTRVFQFTQIVLQTIVLIFTHNYILYLIIYILSTFGLNIWLSIVANKMYPYLCVSSDSKIGDTEKNDIFQNVKALFLYKFGSVILNGTDNIIISAIMGVNVVGIISNYTLVISNITNIVGQAISSLTASVGNLVVNGKPKQIKDVMNQMLVICIWIYGFIFVFLLLLTNDFIFLWIGEEYLVSYDVLAALLLSTYINGLQSPAYTLRTTQGLFVQSKWLPIIAAFINIVLSLWWGRVYGLAGIFIATGISRILTTTLVDPWLVYKCNFNKRPYDYYLKYLRGGGFVFLNLLLQVKILSFVSGDGFVGLVLKGGLLAVSINVVFLLEFILTKDFRGLFKRIKKSKNNYRV